MKNLILFTLIALLSSCTGEQIGDALFDAVVDSGNRSNTPSNPTEVNITGSVYSFYEESGVYEDPTTYKARKEPIADVVINQIPYTPSYDLGSVDPLDIVDSVLSDEKGEFNIFYWSNESFSYLADLSKTSYNSHTEIDKDELFEFVVFNMVPTTIRVRSNNPIVVLNDNVLEWSIIRPQGAGDIADLINEESMQNVDNGNLKFECALKINFVLKYRIRQTAEWKIFNFYRDENIDEYEVWID